MLSDALDLSISEAHVEVLVGASELREPDLLPEALVVPKGKPIASPERRKQLLNMSFETFLSRKQHETQRSERLHEVLDARQGAPIAVNGHGIDAAVLAGLQELAHPPGALADVATHGRAHQRPDAVVPCHALHFRPDGRRMPRVHGRLVVNVGLIEAQQGPEALATSATREVVVMDLDI